MQGTPNDRQATERPGPYNDPTPEVRRHEAGGRPDDPQYYEKEGLDRGRHRSAMKPAFRPRPGRFVLLFGLHLIAMSGLSSQGSTNKQGRKDQNNGDRLMSMKEEHSGTDTFIPEWNRPSSSAEARTGRGVFMARPGRVLIFDLPSLYRVRPWPRPPARLAEPQVAAHVVISYCPGRPRRLVGVIGVTSMAGLGQRQTKLTPCIKWSLRAGPALAAESA